MDLMTCSELVREARRYGATWEKRQGGGWVMRGAGNVPAEVMAELQGRKAAVRSYLDGECIKQGHLGFPNSEA